MTDFLHDNDETLMRYLDGEIDGIEKEQFESQLQKDAALREKLENLRVAIASVQQYSTIEKVKSVHSEMMQELSFDKKEARVVPVRRIVKYGLAIAASVIVILVGVNLFTASQVSSEKLYNEAFVDYDVSVSRGTEPQSQISGWYQAHNYAVVVEKANAQPISQKDSLLVGLSYLQTNQLANAINWLMSISQQSPVKQDAEFYLSMALLRNKNYNEAVTLMKQIQENPNHVYHNQFTQEYIAKVKKLSSK